MQKIIRNHSEETTAYEHTVLDIDLTDVYDIREGDAFNAEGQTCYVAEIGPNPYAGYEQYPSVFCVAEDGSWGDWFILDLNPEFTINNYLDSWAFGWSRQSVVTIWPFDLAVDEGLAYRVIQPGTQLTLWDVA